MPGGVGVTLLPKGDYNTGEKKYVPLLRENALRKKIFALSGDMFVG